MVCEFITGGGLCASPLPDSLAQEGALMRDALLSDLAQLPYEISTTIDARLAPPQNALCTVVSADDDVWQVWRAQINAVDAVWLIAPETDGVLHYLTQMASLQGKLVLGCGLDAIEVTTNKMATFLALTQAKIKTIETLTFEQWQQSAQLNTSTQWLTKPVDGVGCDATLCFDNAENLMNWIVSNKKQRTHIIQPYHAGQPASISCVMHKGRAQVLSCNTQMIDINHHTLSFKGVIVNGMRAHWQAFEQLANQVATAFPDLAGYVGIDVIVNRNEDLRRNENLGRDEIIVVEINPRLTTSYAGLCEAIGANPAGLIINTLINPDFKWPTIQQNMVSLHV